MDNIKHQKLKQYIIFSIMIFLFFLILLLFQGFATWLGWFISDLFSYNRIDEKGIFAPAFVHHVVQMLFALTFILVLKIKFKYDFGFKLGNVRKGIKYTIILILAIVIHSFIFYYIWYKNHPSGAYYYPLNVHNIIGVIGFEYMITGPSEEILFRALPIGLFIIIFKKRYPLIKGISLEVLIATILFVLAHGNYINSGNWYMIGFTFVLGTVFGLTYQKTNSILYPMIMHSMTNMIMISISYLFEANIIF